MGHSKEGGHLRSVVCPSEGSALFDLSSEGLIGVLWNGLF
jgi:hypothetical protein